MVSVPEKIREKYKIYNSEIERSKIKFVQRYKAGKYFALMKLIKSDFKLSKKDAFKDFDAFKFAIDNLYCGKPFHEFNGVNFEECYTEIEKFINNTSQITALSLCNAYAEAFENKFTDNHFGFYVPTDKNNKIRKIASRCFMPFFCGITVEKKNDDFYVVETENNSVKIGDKIEDNGCMFRTFPINGNERYLVGCRSWNKINSIDIICNRNIITVPVHLCRSGEKEKDDIVFSHRNINKYDIIRSNTFSSYSDKTTTHETKAIGNNLKKSNTIIMDLRHNYGGNSVYSYAFFEALNGYCVNPYTVCSLMTPYHRKKFRKKEWIITESERVDLSKAEYKGSFIVLTDYHCASSAEETVNFTKSLKNCIRVGTNTLGCNCYTNLYVAFLPKTHMAIYLPNTAIMDMFEEGKGFEPDYWIDSDDPIDEIINWLQD